MAMREKEREFSFVIQRHLGVMNTYQTGWKKELNLVEWNGTAAKLDIRDWDPEHTHMSRGVTLRREEAEALRELLEAYLQEGEAGTESLSSPISLSTTPASPDIEE